jgi:hypothetical protein
MTAESEEKAAIQIERLVALGYAVTEVTPPLAAPDLSRPSDTARRGFSTFR